MVVLAGLRADLTVAGYGFGAGVTGAGLLMLPMLVAMFVSGVLSGRLVPVFSAKAQLVTGSALAAAAGGLLTVLHAQAWQVALAAGIFGLGIGLAFASMATLIVHSVPATQTGAATGMNANIRTIGGSLGAAVTGLLVTARLQPTGLPQESGYTHGFALLTALCLAAALMALLIPSARTALRRLDSRLHGRLAHGAGDGGGGCRIAPAPSGLGEPPRAGQEDAEPDSLCLPVDLGRQEGLVLRSLLAGLEGLPGRCADRYAQRGSACSMVSATVAATSCGVTDSPRRTSSALYSGA